MEDHIQGVIDTVDAASTYKLQLHELLTALNAAKAQVQTSSTATKESLQSDFENLKRSVADALDNRLMQLLQQVDKIQNDATKPLVQCEELLQQRISVATDALNEGKRFFCDDPGSLVEEMKEFKKKADSLNSLPEVPQLSDVACISLDIQQGLVEKLTKSIQEYGKVLARPPVRISDISERPGALSVKWAEAEDDTNCELSEFQLHYCQGNASSLDASLVFHSGYQGSSTCRTIKHLQARVQYSFRVRGRATGAKSWSPWSVPVVAMTTIPHHEWKEGIEGYELSNEQKIANRSTPYSSENESSPVVFSKCASHTCGHLLTFKVLEDNEFVRTDGIALLTCSSPDDIRLAKGSLFVQADGSVLLDGVEKTTRLPLLKRGSVLTFETEVLADDKVRVTIEVGEKVLTLDWTVTNNTNQGPPPAIGYGLAMMPPQGKDKTINLYFAMRFAYQDWKIAVE